MSDLLLYVLPGIATGFVIGWIARGSLTAAQTQLHQTDALSDADWRTGTHQWCPQWCPRCGRTDGTHTSDCERARLDAIVPPLRGRRFDAHGQDGSPLAPPVRRSDRRG